MRQEIAERLFDEILPCLEERLTEEQLERVLCEFEMDETCFERFDLLYVCDNLQKTMNSTLDAIVDRIMSIFGKKFEKRVSTLINIFSQILKYQKEEKEDGYRGDC